jgi:hypothetical protein
MSVPPQAIAPNPHTNFGNVYADCKKNVVSKKNLSVDCLENVEASRYHNFMYIYFRLQ